MCVTIKYISYRYGEPSICRKLSYGKSWLARIVVTFAVRGLTLTGQALDGPVLSALKRGMDVLEYPEAGSWGYGIWMN